MNSNTTVIEQQQIPLAESVTAAGLPYVDLVMAEGNRNLRAELLSKYYGRNLYLMAHLGNGIGFTINTADVGENIVDVELGSSIKQIPGFAEGFVTYQLVPIKEAKLPYEIGVHMNLDAIYEGRTAYIFSKNLGTGLYELKSVTTVNGIGNVALYTTELTDIMVLLQQ